MKFKLFYHSVVSDWNHGNAHFLRGYATELINLQQEVEIFEPANGWSLQNLKKDIGESSLLRFSQLFPQLNPTFYHNLSEIENFLYDADVVIVHEWNDPALVELIGQLRHKYGFVLLFHDTHHRAVSAPDEMEKYDLSCYDGTLAFGEVIKNIYLENQWTKSAWTWHEAADTNLFRPLKNKKEGHLVWVGNWGDDERSEELLEFLIKPVKDLKLDATMYGVRYPKHAIKALKAAGINYGGYLPSYQVPEVFSRYLLTVHIPRRPYVESLPGIPTIRPFEAMACGLPLVCTPWQDSESLFQKGADYLSVSSAEEMKKALRLIFNTRTLASQLIQNGLKTIQNSHTCRHRSVRLIEIILKLKAKNPEQFKTQSVA